MIIVSSFGFLSFLSVLLPSGDRGKDDKREVGKALHVGLVKKWWVAYQKSPAQHSWNGKAQTTPPNISLLSIRKYCDLLSLEEPPLSLLPFPSQIYLSSQVQMTWLKIRRVWIGGKGQLGRGGPDAIWTWGFFFDPVRWIFHSTSLIMILIPQLSCHTQTVN